MLEVEICDPECQTRPRKNQMLESHPQTGLLGLLGMPKARELWTRGTEELLLATKTPKAGNCWVGYGRLRVPRTTDDVSVGGRRTGMVLRQYDG